MLGRTVSIKTEIGREYQVFTLGGSAYVWVKPAGEFTNEILNRLTTAEARQIAEALSKAADEVDEANKPVPLMPGDVVRDPDGDLVAVSHVNGDSIDTLILQDTVCDGESVGANVSYHRKSLTNPVDLSKLD